jgi:hypothetical protein
MAPSRFSAFERNLLGAQKVQSDVHCCGIDGVAYQNVDPEDYNDNAECYRRFLGHYLHL